MNAISPCPPDLHAEERKARHLRMCQDLAELGMDMARAAAQRARHAWAQEAAAPRPENPAQSQPAQTRRTADPGLLFLRLARSVRDAIALEARIAAGVPEPAPRPNPGPSPDPRRAILRSALHHATENDPDRARIRRDGTGILNQQLAHHPIGEIPIADLLNTTSHRLGLQIDYAAIPEKLRAEINPPPNNQAKIRAGANHAAHGRKPRSAA